MFCVCLGGGGGEGRGLCQQESDPHFMILFGTIAFDMNN